MRLHRVASKPNSALPEVFPIPMRGNETPLMTMERHGADGFRSP